jgi:hypothetical protein
LARDAVVMRSSAPGVPVAAQVALGQSLALPKGAAVTLLFRDGRTLQLIGEGRPILVAAPASRTSAAEEAARALTARPSSRTVIGATRGESDPEMEAAIREGRLPVQDYVVEWSTGCRSPACRAIVQAADRDAPLSLTLAPATDPLAPPETQFTLMVNVAAHVACYAASASAGVREIAPFSGEGLLRAGAAHPAVAVGEAIGPAAGGFIACMASREPRPALRDAFVRGPAARATSAESLAKAVAADPAFSSVTVAALGR